MKKKRTFKRKRTFRKVILRRKSSLRKLIMTHRKRFSKRHNFTRKIGGAPKNGAPKKVQIQQELPPSDLGLTFTREEKSQHTEDVDKALLSDLEKKSRPGKLTYRGSTTVPATSKETSRIAPSSTVQD